MPKGVYERTKKHREATSEGLKLAKEKGIVFGTLGKHWKLSEETKKKMSKSRLGYVNSFETCKKMSEAKKGEKHPNWQGGISKTASKRWRKRNPEKVLFLNLRRIAKKKEAKGFHTFGEWELLKKQYGCTCPCCGKKEPEIKLTEDHIIPLSKGGSDNIENIQPLCKSCNCKKHTKIIKYETSFKNK